MKKLLAMALMIIFMVPAVSLSAPVGRELFEYLVLQYWDLFDLPSTPDVSINGYETYYYSDLFVAGVYYDVNEKPNIIVTVYFKDLDFDFVAYNMTVLIPYFGDEYKDAFLMAMSNFSDGKGIWKTSDDKGTITIKRDSDSITVQVSVR